jgi:uncharacterized peroxidase-related enzyme
MAWIPWVDESDAEGELAEYYAEGGVGSRVDNILKIHSLNPLSLKHHLDMYEHLMRGPSGLSLIEREMIAVVVSRANDCFYWIRHHGAGLRRLLKDADRARAIGKDYREVDLSPRERAMLDYAVKLTRDPGSMSPDDVATLKGAGLTATLKGAGLTDSEVLDICQVTSYFNYVNRLADGLGVELEACWDRVQE